MLSDQELVSHFIIAREYLETHTSETVWRTALRIHELIRMHCPFWRQNEALADEVKFSTLLYSLYSEGEMSVHELDELAGEFFEEGHHEPILFSDAQFPTRKNMRLSSIPGIVPVFQRQNVRAIIVQRELKRLLDEGFSYREATDIVYKLQPQVRDAYVLGFRERGMSSGNLFYKKKSSSNGSIALPTLPKIPENLTQ
ncbi:hypothetical protein KBC86_03685 [Candidatus Gracilibacteria bacterium]|nr:hypothetical protein [Candidatus Gracilibacteria bacterium]